MKHPITQWNPLKELDDFQRRLSTVWNDELARDTGLDEPFAVSHWSPRVDITEDDHEFLLKAELPEIKKEDVHVKLENRVLTISGERKLEKEEKKRKYHRIEREYGAFQRNFALPTGVAANKVGAVFKDGVLKVRLPKDSTRPAESVEVKVT